MMSASGVSTSDDVMTWCLPSSIAAGSAPSCPPLMLIADSLTGMPPFRVMTAMFSASPTSSSGAAGSRRFTHTKAINSA